MDKQLANIQKEYKHVFFKDVMRSDQIYLTGQANNIYQSISISNLDSLKRLNLSNHEFRSEVLSRI